MEKKINITGLQYNILLKKDLMRDYSAMGMHCGNGLIIKLDESLVESLKTKVLIHEIIEALNYEYELKLEHERISILESGLYQVLKSNKWILERLINEE